MGKIRLTAPANNGKEFEKPFAETGKKQKKRKKAINHFNKEYEEVGSLIYLKDAKEKETYSKLDDRMKVLKLELESLFHDRKSENNKDKDTDGCEEDTKTHNSYFCHTDKGNPKIFDSEIELCEKNNTEVKLSKPNVLLPPVKFSKELNNIVNERAFKSQCSNKQLTQEDKSSAESSFKSKFINPCAISINTVEELLFKSFYLQVLGINLYSTDPDQINSCKKLRHQNPKCRKSLKKSTKEKSHQNNLDKFCKSFQKKRSKRRKLNCSDENIEIIDLDHYTESDGQVELGLDLTQYDWSEPFEKYEEAEFLSDVEILEPYEQNQVSPLKLEKSAPVENEVEIVDVECAKIESKTGWECPICFEQSRGQEVVATLCGHVFCKACLENYHSKFGECCPTCRTDLTNKEPIALFNL